MDDLLRSIKFSLEERASNPLVGTTVLAWILWNFKLILIVFTTSGWGELNSEISNYFVYTLSYFPSLDIETRYTVGLFLNGLAMPFSLALFYLFIFSKFSNFIELAVIKLKDSFKEELLHANKQRVYNAQEYNKIKEQLRGARDLLEEMEVDYSNKSQSLQDQLTNSNKEVETLRVTHRDEMDTKDSQHDINISLMQEQLDKANKKIEKAKDGIADISDKLDKSTRKHRNKIAAVDTSNTIGYRSLSGAVAEANEAFNGKAASQLAEGVIHPGRSELQELAKQFNGHSLVEKFKEVESQRQAEINELIKKSNPSIADLATTLTDEVSQDVFRHFDPTTGDTKPIDVKDDK